MKVVFLFLFLCIALLPAPAHANDMTYPLEGLVIVLDPGHGGEDPTYGKTIEFLFDPTHFFNLPVIKTRPIHTAIPEDEYAYDIALRIQEIAESAGAQVFLTIYDPIPKYNQIRDAVYPVFENNLDEVFSLDDTPVFTRKKTKGKTLTLKDSLQKRIDYSHQIASHNSFGGIVFISVHLDNLLGRLQPTQGVQVITPDTHLSFSQSISDSFPQFDEKLGSGPFLRKKDGHIKHGTGDVPVLYLLRSANNKIKNRVLIEFANNNQGDDRNRVLNSTFRQKCAEILISGITSWWQKQSGNTQIARAGN